MSKLTSRCCVCKGKFGEKDSKSSISGDTWGYCEEHKKEIIEKIKEKIKCSK